LQVEELRRAEKARKAENARQAKAAQKAEAEEARNAQAEVERLAVKAAAEAKAAEEIRAAEEVFARVKAAQEADALRQLEESRAREAALATAGEQKRKIAEGKARAKELKEAEALLVAEEARLAAETKAAKEAELVKEARRAEIARKVELARAAKADEERVAEEVRVAEEARKAWKQENARKLDEAREAEEARLAVGARVKEEERLTELAAAEARAAEEIRKTNAAKAAAEEARLQAQKDRLRAEERQRQQEEASAATVLAAKAEEESIGAEARARVMARFDEKAQMGEESRLAQLKAESDRKAEQLRQDEAASVDAKAAAEAKVVADIKAAENVKAAADAKSVAEAKAAVEVTAAADAAKVEYQADQMRSSQARLQATVSIKLAADITDPPASPVHSYVTRDVIPATPMQMHANQLGIAPSSSLRKPTTSRIESMDGGIGGEGPIRRREQRSVPVPASLVLGSPLPRHLSSRGVVRTATATISSSIADFVSPVGAAHLPVAEVNAAFTPTPKERASYQQKHEDTASEVDTFVVPSVRRQPTSPTAGAYEDPAKQLRQPAIANLSSSQRNNDELSRKHVTPSKKGLYPWGGHDVSSRIAAILDNESGNISSVTASPDQAREMSEPTHRDIVRAPPGPHQREMQALLVMNMKLNDVVQQQEELRLQESQDFLYAMNAVEQELRDACDKNRSTESAIDGLKQQMTALQEEVVEHQLREAEQRARADTAEEKILTITEYTREIETKVQAAHSTAATNKTVTKSKGSKPASGQPDGTGTIAGGTINKSLLERYQAVIDLDAVKEEQLLRMTFDRDAAHQTLAQLQAEAEELAREHRKVVSDMEDKLAASVKESEKIHIDYESGLSRQHDEYKRTLIDLTKEKTRAQDALAKSEADNFTMNIALEKLIKSSQLNTATISSLQAKNTDQGLLLQTQRMELDVVAQNEAQRKAVRKRANDTEAALASLLVQQNRLERENESLREQLADLATTELNLRLPLEDKIVTLTERLTESEEASSAAKTHVTKLSAMLAVARTQAKDAQADLEFGTKIWEKEVAASQNELVSLQTAAREDHEALSSKLSAKTIDLQAQTRLVSELRISVMHLEERSKDAEDAAERAQYALTSDTATLQDALDASRARIATLKTQLKETEEAVQVTTTKLKTLEMRYMEQEEMVHMCEKNVSEKGAKLAAALATLERQRERAIDADAQKEKAFSALSVLEVRLNSCLAKLELAVSRADKAQAEGDELAKRLVETEGRLELMSTTVTRQERDVGYLTRGNDDLKDKLSATESKLRNLQRSEEAGAELRLVHEESNIELKAWKKRHEDLMETLRLSRNAEAERCLELRRALRIIGVTHSETANEMKTVDSSAVSAFLNEEEEVARVAKDWAVRQAGLAQELCDALKRLRSEFVQALESFTIARLENTFDDADEEELRMNAQVQLLQAAFNNNSVGEAGVASDSLNILLDVLMGNMRKVQQYENDRYQRLGRRGIFTAANQGEKFLEEVAELEARIAELEETLAARERTHKDNLEILATTETEKAQTYEQHVTAESNRRAKAAEDAANEANAERQLLTALLEESKSSQEILLGTMQTQQKEIEMLRADICRAVDQNGLLQQKVTQSERSYDQALEQLERAQLKSSQETRKRLDVERTLRRLTTTGYGATTGAGIGSFLQGGYEQHPEEKPYTPTDYHRNVTRGFK